MKRNPYEDDYCYEERYDSEEEYEAAVAEQEREEYQRAMHEDYLQNRYKERDYERD